MRRLSVPSRGVEAAVTVAIAVIEPIGAALVAAGADQTFDSSFHQNLQYRLRYGSQEISLAALLQQLDQRRSLIGPRVLGQFGVKRCNSTLANLPGDHPSLTRAPSSMYWGIALGARSPPNFHHDRGR
jgi:hypothetical protein